MRPERFDAVLVSETSGTLPLRSRQTPPPASHMIKFGLLALLASAVLLPQLGLAAYGAFNADLRQQILDHPMIAIQFVAVLGFWLVLFGLPMHKMICRLLSRRSVEITSTSVAVDDLGVFGNQAWNAPLTEFSGIAHHVRSSLGGTRHELVLIHPDSRKSVLLLRSEHISDTDVERFSALLRVPHIPAAELYRLGKGRGIGPRVAVSEPLAA
jgi:hypothetical protein